MDGLVGILTGKGPACDELTDWLAREGFHLADDVVRVPGNNIPWQRNEVARAMYDRGRAWVLYVDADEVPEPGAAVGLLGTGLPLVSGVVLDRRHPFEACILKSLEPLERYTDREFCRAFRAPVPVPACGAGFLLVRRAVFDAVGPPWFRAGQIDPETIAEDLDFSLRAAEAGFPPYVHPGVRVGHRPDAPIIYPSEDGPVVNWYDGHGRLPWRELLYPNLADGRGPMVVVDQALLQDLAGGAR